VRVREGAVELDMAPPDLAAAIPGMWASLEEALVEYRIGQATRDAARLLDAGVTPEALAAFVAAFDGGRALYGATHALPIAYDLLQWKDRYPGARFAIPLAQALDMAARGSVRRPVRALAPPEDPGDDPVAAGERLRARVEAEDAAGAEAILRGALARGWGRAEIEPWLLRLCADHFLSFGHRLIYQVKVFDLLDVAGWDRAEPILCGHLYGIVNGTREDVLPAWTGFRRRVDALDLEALYAAVGTNPGWDGAEALLAAITDGAPREALSAMVAALEAGAPLDVLASVVSLGAAERMLRFDVSIDSDPSNQDNWLSATHIQTYAHAARHALRRLREPASLRLLLYGARFVNHHRVLDAAPEARDVPGGGGDLEALLAAIGSKDAPAAMGAARSLLETPEGTAALREAAMDYVISDVYARPIVSAHAIKNLVVALEETAATGDVRPALAFARLAASPLQQRWTFRGAREGVAFVTEGRVPKLLAP